MANYQVNPAWPKNEGKPADLAQFDSDLARFDSDLARFGTVSQRAHTFERWPSSSFSRSLGSERLKEELGERSKKSARCKFSAKPGLFGAKPS